MYRLLYPNLMVITNGKSTVGAHGKNSQNTTLKLPNHKRREEKRNEIKNLRETIPEQLIK